MVPISKWLKHLNTVLHTTGHRGHYHQDGWRVSGELGGDGEGLWNREDSITPPETGSWYWAGTWIEHGGGEGGGGAMWGGQGGGGRGGSGVAGNKVGDVYVHNMVERGEANLTAERGQPCLGV